MTQILYNAHPDGTDTLSCKSVIFVTVYHVSLGRLSSSFSSSCTTRLGGGDKVTGLSWPVTLSLAIWVPFVLFHFIRLFWNHTLTCKYITDQTNYFMSYIFFKNCIGFAGTKVSPYLENMYFCHLFFKIWKMHGIFPETWNFNTKSGKKTLNE